MGFYKYLGTYEADCLKYQLMKSLLTKEYKHQVRKFLRTNLYSRNLISAINSCATSLLRYSGRIVKPKLRCLRWTVILESYWLCMEVLDRLYLLRKNGVRGLISVKFAIEHEQRNLSLNFYAHHSCRWSLHNVGGIQLSIIRGAWKAVQTIKWQWMSPDLEKPASPWSVYKRGWGTFCIKFHWSWLRFSNLLRFSNFTKEMEGLLFAAQEQAVSTNAIKVDIYCSQISARCMLCGSADETIDHLVSYCPVLA